MDLPTILGLFAVVALLAIAIWWFARRPQSSPAKQPESHVTSTSDTKPAVHSSD